MIWHWPAREGRRALYSGFGWELGVCCAMNAAWCSVQPAIYSGPHAQGWGLLMHLCVRCSDCCRSPVLMWLPAHVPCCHAELGPAHV